MKKLTILIAVLCPMVAFAFPFDVKKTLNGTQIAVDTLALSDNLASASLSNYGQRNAVCQVRFRNGPEAPRTRKARVHAGETAHVTARFNSTVIRMRVNVECKYD